MLHKIFILNFPSNLFEIQLVSKRLPNDIWNQVGNKFSWSRICFANCNGYPDSVMLKSGLKAQILGKTCCIFMNSSHWLLTNVRCLSNACHVILQLLHEWKCNIAIRYNCIITRSGSTNAKAMHKNTSIQDKSL